MKLQPPSGTELPAFNPIVHPSAITQVLLLANPQKVTALTLGHEQRLVLRPGQSLVTLFLSPLLSVSERAEWFVRRTLPPLLPSDCLSFLPHLQEKVRLRYKLTFTMGEQTYNEMGDVDQFPPPESWGNL